MYKIKIIKNILIPMILSIIFALPALGKDAEIRWKEVKRSYGYIVEIKNIYNIVILRRQTKKTYINFSVPQGTYYCKISVLNKFKKVSVSSKWFKIIIKMLRNIYIYIKFTTICHEFFRLLIKIN